MRMRSRALLVLLLCSLLAGAANAEPSPDPTYKDCHPGDKAALLAVKAALGGAYHFASWTPDNPCCDWYDVTCDHFTGRVVGLAVFQDANLTGTIPSAAAGVPPSSLLRLRLPSPQPPAVSLPSSAPRPLLSLTAAPPRASFAAAADSSNGNGSYSGNGSQASLMPPFNGLMLDESSRSKRPYKWQRVLLKVSGEALAGDHMENIDPKVTMAIAREVASVTKLGVEVAIVVGGGNIFRGASWAGCSGLDRSSADYIGMMATVMNAIFLQATMESIGIPTRVQTAFRISEVAEPYIRRRAIRHLEKGRVVIFAAGTGNPFFTTDTAAALRCAEINAEVVLKATNVDGVYDANPKHNPNARILETVSYNEVISRDLSVMDMTAVTLCQENNIPVVVFNLQNTGNIAKAIVGEKVGTFIGCTRNLEYRESTEGSLDQEDKILVTEW